MPPFPDQYLIPHVLSLQQFVKTAHDVGDEDEGDQLANFVLAGHGRVFVDEFGHPELRPARVFVNPRLNLSGPNLGRYSIRGDFDSVIGLTEKLPFTKAISWHAFPIFSDTLTTDVHIKVPITNAVCLSYAGEHKY